MADVKAAGSAAVERIRSMNEWLLLVGGLMLVFFIVCTLLEVQTSESAITHGGMMTLLKPDPATFTQLVDLVAGKLSPSEIVVVIWGWGSQIIYFACIVGYNLFHKAIAKHNSWLAMLCAGVAAAITFYNCVTDYNYVGLVIQNGWWQLAITSVIALGSAALGIAGIHFIKAAFGKE